MSKICRVCQLEKTLNSFHKSKQTKDGLTSKCNVCISQYMTLCCRAKSGEYQKKYHKENKEKLKVKQQEYYSKNIERIKDARKVYSEANIEKRKDYLKNNRIKLNKQKVERISNNPLLKLSIYVGNLIRHSLKTKNFSKKSKSLEIIGASFQKVLNKLNDNPYGFVFGDKDLDIDHIIPLDSAQTEDEVLSLNHYSNLQLLPSEYNRHIKITKAFNRIHFENWFYNKRKNN